jgi:hypothetical protein
MINGRKLLERSQGGLRNLFRVDAPKFCTNKPIYGGAFVPEDAPETLGLLLPRPEIRRNLNDDAGVW